MAPFTPAPWVLNPDPTAGLQFRVDDKDGGAIAGVWGANAEALANARLIEAAPILYAELSRVDPGNHVLGVLNALAEQVAS